MAHGDIDVVAFEKTVTSLLNHFDTANYYLVNEEYPDEQQFPNYCGAMMTKPGLLMWLNDFILAYAAVEMFSKYTDESLGRKLYLERQKERRPLPPVYEMPPPTGFDLFGRKRREYENWLAQAPQREARRRQAAEAEELRIAKAEEELSELNKKREIMHNCGPLLLELCKKLNYMHVIAPDYRKTPVPEILANYLRANRANTLQEAVNLYHEEEFRREMLNLQKQQIIELRRAASLQQTALRRQQEQRAREKAAIQEYQQAATEELRGIRNAVDWIAFYEALNFWLK